MLPILETPSFGTGLAKGLSAGMQQSLPSIVEMITNKQKTKAMKDAFPNLFGTPQQEQAPIDKEQRFRDLALQIEQQTGQDLQGIDLDQLWKSIQTMPDLGMQQNIPQQANQPQYTHEDAVKASLLGYEPLSRAISTAAAAEQKEKSQEKKSQLESYKLSKDFRSQVAQGSQGAKTSNIILDRMESLNKEGKLTSPALAKISESLGIPISILANPESEEFEKLSNNLTREISSIYKGRILASEFNNFLKQIPTLMNSKEGRERVIESMKMINDPKIEQAKISRQIIKENKGLPPFDLEDQVSERMDVYLDKLAETFKEKSSSPMPMQASKGHVLMISPDGQMGEVEIKNVNAALKRGYKKHG